MRDFQQRKSARSERWARENAAPRLKHEVPKLASLRMNLVELSGVHSIAGTRRIQHVVVDQASSRFEVACGETKCEEGGHDLTRTALSALRAGQTAFDGTSECTGHVGDRPCERKLQYSFEATFTK